MMMTDDADKRVPHILPIEFWQDTEESPDGTLVTVDFVKWIKKGNSNHGGEDKIPRIKRSEPDLWVAIEPFYKAWKDKLDAPVNGTPIGIWPGVTRKMADVMKTLGIMSVEDLAASTDADLARIGMGAMGMREKAKAFLSLKDGDSKTARQLVTLQEKNEALEEQNKALMEAVEALKSQVGSLATAMTEETVKRRGRPKKED